MGFTGVKIRQHACNLVLAVLEIEARGFGVLGRQSAAKLHPQSFSFSFSDLTKPQKRIKVMRALETVKTLKTIILT